jgi:signal transduction histidine kinase
MYAGVFTVSLNIVYWIFYVVVLYGSHGFSKQDLSAIRHDFREFLAWPLLIIIVLSALAGWFMARRALSGVVQLTRTASAVSEGALNERVPVKGQKDEIDRLAETFNTMLEKINILILGMKETNDNIAHDLRSPITRLRGNAEPAITAKAEDGEAQPLAGHIIEECDHLLAMINAMLDISEAEAGIVKLNIEQIDVVSMIHDAVDLFRPLADNKHIDIEVRTPDVVSVNTDKRRLQRVLGNLLDNALKYSRSPGNVRIAVNADDGHAVIEIDDNGIGISAEDLPHIFDRFFRAEKSRTAPGSGLGLSLAKAFVISLGGSISVNSILDEGSVFTVVLPRRI